MFNRYWRTYPWYIQLFQFIILMLVLFSFFGMGMTPVLLKAMNVSVESFQSMSEKSPRNVINAGLWVQFLTATGLFLLPPLLFAYFTHPRPMAYLGLQTKVKWNQLFYCLVIVICATPLLLSIAEWVSSLNIEAARKAQEENDRLMKAFLSMRTIGEFIATFFVIAVLAGLGEELFFRGLLMRFSAKRMHHAIPPIVISALLFAMMHSNIYGLPSIFIAGLLLGSFYYLTGSLWNSIAAHVVYNGLQVALIFFAGSSDTLTDLNEHNHVPITWVVIGTLLSVAAFYALWKQRTPLAPGWAADYTPDEIANGVDKEELA